MPDAPSPTTPCTTAQLLDRARAGDEAARDQLFTTAVPPLLTYVRVRLGTKLAALVEPADVVQDTFAAALASMAEFEPVGKGAFVAWLCRIAERQIHGLADHFAAGKRRLPGQATPWTAIATRLFAAGTSPGSAAARNDERQRLERALHELPDNEREVVLLCFFEERALRDVAEASGRATTTVHRLLGRATAHLGETLGRALDATPRASDGAA